MKQLATISILCLLLSSCMTTTKYATFVDTKTKNIRSQQDIESDWLIIKSSKDQPTANEYIQEENEFVPAILYWAWNSTIDCELDIETRTKYMKEAIHKASVQYNLQDQLAGGVLEITLNELPGKFQYVNKGTVVFLVIAYTTSGVEAISPFPIDLEYEYTFTKDDNSQFFGKGFVLNDEEPLRNVWKSSKKFTWRYFEEFRAATERMGQELVQDILDELANETQRNQNE